MKKEHYVIVILVLTIGFMFFTRNTGQVDITGYTQTIEMQNDSIELLKKKLKTVESRTDTIMDSIIEIRVIRDTIWREIARMEPDELVREFDKQTGIGEPTKIVDGYALVPMPRIQKAVIEMEEKKYLLQENNLMQQVIESKKIENQILKQINTRQDTIIKSQYRVISEQEKDLRRKNLRGKIFEYGFYGSVIYAIVKIL